MGVFRASLGHFGTLFHNLSRYKEIVENQGLIRSCAAVLAYMIFGKVLGGALSPKIAFRSHFGSRCGQKKLSYAKCCRMHRFSSQTELIRPCSWPFWNLQSTSSGCSINAKRVNVHAKSPKWRVWDPGSGAYG